MTPRLPRLMALTVLFYLFINMVIPFYEVAVANPSYTPPNIHTDTDIKTDTSIDTKKDYKTNTQLDTKGSKTENENNGNEDFFDNPNFKAVKFSIKDVLIDWVGSIYDMGNEQVDPNISKDADLLQKHQFNKFGEINQKLTRGFIGAFISEDGNYGKAVKIGLDFLDVKDKINEALEFREKYQLAKEAREALAAGKSATQEGLNALKPLSKVGQVMGWANIVYNGAEGGYNIYKAFTTKDNPATDYNESTMYTMKALGNAGEMLMSGGALVGTTPAGWIMMGTGALLYAASYGYQNWPRIQSVAKAVGRKITNVWNTVKGWFS